MNYYNPYYNFPYSTMSGANTGLFSRLLGGVKGLNWGSMFTNVQKTLNLVNQAIPVVKQASPMFKNAKTMFHLMSEFNKGDINTPTKSNTENKKEDRHEDKKKASVSSTTETTTKKMEPINISNGPTFFL